MFDECRVIHCWRLTDDLTCCLQRHLHQARSNLKWHTEFGHLNRGDMLTSEQHRCSNEKKKF
ncbi:hypothetical protein AJR18_017760 [Shigella boydii]|nr:hypothetical protein AJR18_017760 [Shigella boydii]OOP14466.1 hypothetical protein AJR26_015020 [Shigella flexneri]